MTPNKHTLREHWKSTPCRFVYIQMSENVNCALPTHSLNSAAIYDTPLEVLSFVRPASNANKNSFNFREWHDKSVLDYIHNGLIISFAIAHITVAMLHAEYGKLYVESSTIRAYYCFSRQTAFFYSRTHTNSCAHPVKCVRCLLLAFATSMRIRTRLFIHSTNTTTYHWRPDTRHN